MNKSVYFVGRLIRTNKELTEKLFLFQSPESLQTTMIDPASSLSSSFVLKVRQKMLIHVQLNLFDQVQVMFQPVFTNLYIHRKLDVSSHLESAHLYFLFDLYKHKKSVWNLTHTSNSETNQIGGLLEPKSELEKVLFSLGLCN